MNKIFFAICLLSFAFAAQAQIAIKAETLYTVSGSPIRDAVVLVKNGKIENAGANLHAVVRVFTKHNISVGGDTVR